MYKANNSGDKQHVFAQVPHADIPRSVFNRSHTFKTTLDSDYLIPFYVDEALPGDTFNLNATVFARMATPIAPLMDNLKMDTFYFAVPLRLVWTNFPKFMGEQATPGASTSFTVPQIVSPAGGWLEQSLSDYMGLPIKIAGLSVSSLWHRAYNLIYDKWFRDENVQTPPVVDLDDGPDTDSDYVPLKRNKKHDYFTSALPWPQKGATAVSIPLGTTAPIIGIGKETKTFNTFSAVWETGGGNPTYSAAAELNAANLDSNVYIKGTAAANGTPLIYADLSTATAATINSLRQAFQLQKLLERDARGGTRYTEIIKSHFGVSSPDARLQRPEYLGGSSAPVNITPIPQTSSTTGSYAQGRLAGFGVGVDQGTGFTKSFTEHCVIIGMVCIRAAENIYQQGINKMFLRSSKYDYYWPALANIGEQAITNNEIYAVAVAAPGDAGDLQNKAVFGYQERYAEYRYKPSVISGKLRSTATTPLDVWHLAQNFTGLPTLSTAFLNSATPMARVSAVNGEPSFIMDAFIDCRTARPMPVYSVPGLIDHF